MHTGVTRYLKTGKKKTQSESMSAVNAKQVKVTGRLKRIVGFPVRYKEILVSFFFPFLVQKTASKI